MYCERAGLLQGVLNESYQLYRFGHNLVSVFNSILVWLNITIIKFSKLQNSKELLFIVNYMFNGYALNKKF